MKLIRKILKWWRGDLEFWRLVRRADRSEKKKRQETKIREQILFGDAADREWWGG